MLYNLGGISYFRYVRIRYAVNSVKLTVGFVFKTYLPSNKITFFIIQ